MNSLVKPEYIQIARDNYMLQYTLQQRGMLSTTGYKVLKEQEAEGLIPCVRVIYDGLEKLDYDIENFQDMESAVSNLQPNVFLHYAREIFILMQNMQNIGFLHAYNVETSLDNIFIDNADYTVHMIYLPIVDDYLQYRDKTYEHRLKASLHKAIQENENLQSESSNMLMELLSDQTSTLENLSASLATIEPLQKAEPRKQTGTIELEQATDEISQSENLSPETLAQDSANTKVEKPKKRFFFFKPKADEPEIQIESGGTEVLSMFVPSVYLKGSGKEEYLINKQEYILGRDSSADGVISSSTVSRQHCKITSLNEQNFVTDLGSANGTYLNGVKLEPNKPGHLNEGDKLKLGNESFVVMNV